MGAVADHLWQSTWFAGAAWLLVSLVRNDLARVRYWVWFAASVKFLVPFALLSWVGNHFVLQVAERPVLLPIMQHVTAPMADVAIRIDPFAGVAKYTIAAVWALGSAVVLVQWISEWLRGRRELSHSSSCDTRWAIEVRCSERLAEPVVIGILRPVVLIPHSVLSALTPAQINAVVSHELWHVRRRDNLMAGVHLLVQVLFWFHPLVWLIGAKLLLEREHACDEAVVHEGHDAHGYAEGLLRVCSHAVASRHACTASAAGGDLGARLRAIVSPPVPPRRLLLRRIFLAAALLCCAGLPVALGVTLVATTDLKVAAGSRLLEASDFSGPTFVVVQDDYVYARNVSIRELISHVYSVKVREVAGSKLDYPRYDVELRALPHDLNDQRELVAKVLKQRFNLELIVRPG